jgi:hypothetical protein
MKQRIPTFDDFINESKDYEKFCDFGCGYIGSFVKNNPSFDCEEFYDYCSNHNKACRDSGELQDICKDEILRLAKAFKPSEKINESIQALERMGCERDGKPSIFCYTIYRFPDAEEFKEFEEFPDLTPDQIVQGFSYTMIGRGMPNPSNKKLIKDSIEKLIELYPDKETYKEALNLFNKESY